MISDCDKLRVMTNASIDIRLLGGPDEEKRARVEIVRYTPWARAGKAAGALSVCWLAAVAALPIPGVHFLLVPLFLLSGPIAAFLIGRRLGYISHGSIECPKCNSAFSIDGLPIRFPQYAECSACHQQIFLEELLLSPN